MSIDRAWPSAIVLRRGMARAERRARNELGHRVSRCLSLVFWLSLSLQELAS